MDTATLCDGRLPRRRPAVNARRRPTLDAHAARLRQFSLLNLALDYCLACRGVWVDGDEHVALAATRAAEPALSDPYRRRAEAEALFLGRVACVYCKVELPLRESVMTADGVSCDACAVAPEGDAATSDPRLFAGDTGAWAFLRAIGSALGQVLLWTLEHRHCPGVAVPRAGVRTDAASRRRLGPSLAAAPDAFAPVGILVVDDRDPFARYGIWDSRAFAAPGRSPRAKLMAP